MKIGRLLGLFLLLWMGLIANGEETMSTFISDILSTFRLGAPTIIYEGDEAPEVCYANQGVLCLPSRGIEIESDPKEFASDKEELGSVKEKEIANDSELLYNIVRTSKMK